MSEVIRTRREGGVVEVTLDRPKANAIDLVTSRIMGETFKAFRDDPELRVAIVTGAGGAVLQRRLGSEGGGRRRRGGWRLRRRAGSPACRSCRA